MIKLTQIKGNPNNPRLIKDDKFKLLCERIKSNPNTLKYRPIVIDTHNVIQAGNMRYKALKELGYKEVPNEWIVKADDLTDEQMREFVVVDNVGYGEWDYDLLKNQYSAEELSDWGVDVPQFAAPVDYSILDDDDVSEQLGQMTEGVKKAIQIEFEAEHYEEAYELVKYWREQKAYVGGMIMEHLKEEKDKI